MTDQVWKIVPGASALWASPDGRWQTFQHYGTWMLRDLTIVPDPKTHGTNRDRGFYSIGALIKYIDAVAGGG